MLKISQQITIKLIVAINTLANLHFFISRPCLSPSPRLSTPATFPGALPRAKERRTVAFLLLRKTARAVVRRARRTLFAPRFRSRSIVAPAHKPATIFSDQSPRDEHERLREVRVRFEGNGATKKPQHSLRLFLVHHRGRSRGLRNAALWRSLWHCVPPPCSSISDAAPDRAFLK